MSCIFINLSFIYSHDNDCTYLQTSESLPYTRDEVSVRNEKTRLKSNSQFYFLSTQTWGDPDPVLAGTATSLTHSHDASDATILYVVNVGRVI